MTIAEEKQKLAKAAVELIDKEGISQVEAARRVGVDQSYVSRYMVHELGRRTRHKAPYTRRRTTRQYAKITDEIVQQVKGYIARSWTQTRIARKVGISTASVARIIHGDDRYKGSRYNRTSVPKKAITAIEEAFPTTDTFDRIDIEIMKTQMRLEILKELKGK